MSEARETIESLTEEYINAMPERCKLCTMTVASAGWLALQTARGDLSYSDFVVKTEREAGLKDTNCIMGAEIPTDGCFSSVALCNYNVTSC